MGVECFEKELKKEIKIRYKEDEDDNDKSKKIRKELLMGLKSIDFELVDELRKSVCKIKYKINEQDYVCGTGFFMNYQQFKSLITAYHIINPDLENKSIEIEIYNKEKVTLILNNRIIKYFEDLDISVIEIKESLILNNKDIKYLKYDLNYKEGYEQYKLIDIICLQYPGGGNLNAQIGKIINVKNEYEFEHNISTEPGSSGSPIIISSIKRVIGIHTSGDFEKEINIGTFISEIFNENNLYRENKKNNKIEEKKILNLSFKSLGNEGIRDLIKYNKIIELNLSGNNISDIKVLENVNFDKLEILNLEYNNISNINILENVNFKELKELNLHWNKISDIKVLEKVKFDKLEKLYLGYNNIFSNIYILENVNFKELKELNLSGNKIIDIEVLVKVKFDKLEILDLEQNNISNINILKEVNFIELKVLNLRINKIKDIEVLEKVKFDKLEILDLGYNNISNINILKEVDFKELKVLDLRNNIISDVKVLEKVNFDKLEKLYLWNNDISNIQSIIPKLKFKLTPNY